MIKIMICLLAPLAVLFAGLTPIHMWAIPAAIGVSVIIGILYVNDRMDDNVSN